MNLQFIIHKAFEIVERDHGGCEDEDCSLRQAIELGLPLVAIDLYASSGAPDEEFYKLADKLTTLKSQLKAEYKELSERTHEVSFL